MRWSSPPGQVEPVPQGGLLSLSPANLAFSLLLCPHPPDPLPLRGRGGLKVILCKGLRPLHPRGCTRAAPVRLRVSVCLRGAVPAAKERGDRGRWNYPSQATAAFEMVLSPGAGRTSAAGVQPPLRAPQRQGKQVPQGGKPPLRFPHRQGQPVPPDRRQKPTPLPSFPFPQQSPHKENHAVDERREENRQNNMRENTEPEKADRRNRTRRESRGKHAE